MKTRHKHWRNRAYKYLLEKGEPMTAGELLDATRTVRSPTTAQHAALLLRVDKRFVFYLGDPHYVGETGGNRRVLMFEVLE
jgi:hypothetical protein